MSTIGQGIVTLHLMPPSLSLLRALLLRVAFDVVDARAAMLDVACDGTVLAEAVPHFAGHLD